LPIMTKSLTGIFNILPVCCKLLAMSWSSVLGSSSPDG
jgi:hypothetical protein